MFQQAERGRHEGEVHVQRIDAAGGETLIAVSVTHDGATETVHMADHNASRVFALLAVMLGFPMNRDFKSIKL